MKPIPDGEFLGVPFLLTNSVSDDILVMNPHVYARLLVKLTPSQETVIYGSETKERLRAQRLATVPAECPRCHHPWDEHDVKRGCTRRYCDAAGDMDDCGCEWTTATCV